MSNAADKLRAAVDASGMTWKAVAVGAGVNYQNFANWMNGKVAKLDLAVAEKVWKFLTGEGFVE